MTFNVFKATENWDSQPAPVQQRENEICQASRAAKAAFARISRAAPKGEGVQERVFSVFRWYFLSAFCTRLLSNSVHRLEHQTLQVSMDIYSAVRMVLPEDEVERSMALVRVDSASPAEAREGTIGARGHKVGWIAAGLHKKGQELPAEIENALAGALAASNRLN